MTDGQRRGPGTTRTRVTATRRTTPAAAARATAHPSSAQQTTDAPATPDVVPAPVPVPAGKAKTSTAAAKATSKTTRSGRTSSKASAAKADATGEVAGVDATATTQSGTDTRRRGWFWHWNSIVTQFSPLIGLKGVGLLNSYTVWTDRREDSPNRGYAFPSQQSEADFYGEERAELIAINKILVTLDLIEIRKEMIVKPDASGRKWKVPHNFYRVKDHDDGYVLDADAVLRVVRLADGDRQVFRHLRRLFSPRFRPIDGDSVWHGIMPVVRRDPTWQRLAAKVEADERRASDRTRAGHAARNPGASGSDGRATTDTGAVLFTVPGAVDSESATLTGNDTKPSVVEVANPAEQTSVAQINTDTKRSRKTSVASANDGSGMGVATGNSGSRRKRSSSVAGSNDGRPTTVAATNTTYDQLISTTRTTTSAGAETDGNDENETKTGVESGASASTGGSGSSSAGRLARRVRARRGAVAPVTPAVPAAAAQAEPTVSAAPVSIPASAPVHRPPVDGAGPDAGSVAIRAFEDANDRATTPAQRQLLAGLANEFEAAARRAGTAGSPNGSTGWGWVAAAIYEAVESGSAYVAPRRIREILTRWAREGRPGENRNGGPDDDGSTPGRGKRTTGRGRTASRTETPARPTPVRPATPDPAVPATASATRPVARRGAARSGSAAARTAASPVIAPVPARDTVPAAGPFIVTECGLPSTQVWAAILTELSFGTEIPRADLDGAIRTAELVGRDGNTLIIGAHSAVTQRRASRYLPVLARAATVIIGRTVRVEIVDGPAWLARNPERGLGADTSEARAARG
ncbi:MAG TPA: hypothetical protein VGT61_08780 [Thermomicrobiales bacterium]|jgi:hypothetical protein|nr:hypothetical protein [Thermomicrobiales bacterium]